MTDLIERLEKHANRLEWGKLAGQAASALRSADLLIAELRREVQQWRRCVGPRFNRLLAIARHQRDEARRLTKELETTKFHKAGWEKTAWELGADLKEAKQQAALNAKLAFNHSERFVAAEARIKTLEEGVEKIVRQYEAEENPEFAAAGMYDIARSLLKGGES